MSNKLLFGDEARAKLKAGIDLVKNAVAPTLGANGRNTVYNKWSRVPIITNDGVSIAREVEPEDLGELQGANLIKQVSERTNDEAGDGTTTSIVLAHSMIEEGMKLLDNDKTINPMQLRREMKDATEKVLEALKESAVKVDTLESLEHVATISVESPEIGKTIAQAIFDAGDNGVVYVDESTNIGVTVEKLEGYQFGQGWVSPYMVNNTTSMQSELENTYVLCIEAPLHMTNEFIKLVDTLNAAAENENIRKSLLIIGDEINPQVIAFANNNNIEFLKRVPRHNLWITIVKKPMQAHSLEDIAVVVGATAMTKDSGLLKPDVRYLGRCSKVVVKKDVTILFTDTSAKYNIDIHINDLKSQIENSTNDIDKTKLQERIAKLIGGVYMINVGEKTEAESKYLKMKVDDAVNATKAAREEGIVAGGGMALFNASRLLMDDKTDGASVIYQACLSPLKTIIDNSGENYTDIFNEVENSTKGFNALTLQIEPDVIAAGIIDPVKVTRCAFANASSFAGLLLTTETLIIPIPQPELYNRDN